jgi:hypothetical protein
MSMKEALRLDLRHYRAPTCVKSMAVSARSGNEIK